MTLWHESNQRGDELLLASPLFLPLWGEHSEAEFIVLKLVKSLFQWSFLNANQLQGTLS